jgi:5'(3')-deoxyribonucleotidase
MDGVLADFFRAALSMYGMDIDDCNAQQIAGGWIPEICNTTEEEFWSRVNHDWWTQLKPLPDAREILEIAERHGDTCILTSPGNDPSGCSGKKAWVDHNLPEWRDRVLIGKPKHLCAASGHYLWDDWAKQVQRFSQYGGRGVLVPRKWNALHATNPIEYLNSGIWKL